MGQMKTISFDKKVFWLVCVACLIRIIAPKSVLISIFSLDWHLRDGAIYPLLSYISINLIILLFVLFIMTLIILLVDILMIFLKSDNLCFAIKSKLDSGLEFTLNHSGILSTWLFIVLGVFTLLRGVSAINQIISLIFSDFDQLRHPAVLFFILFVLYSLMKRFIKLDFIELIINFIEVADIEEDVEDEYL